MSRRQPPEGRCATCGGPVRRWQTSTGWKHVSGWHTDRRACPDSPPSRILTDAVDDAERAAVGE